MNHYILYVILSVLLMNNPLLVAMEYETIQEKKEEEESEPQTMELMERNSSLESMQQELILKEQVESKKRKAVDPIMLEKFKKAKQIEQDIRTTYGNVIKQLNKIKSDLQASPHVGCDEYKKEYIALVTYQEKIITAFLEKPLTKERNDLCDQRIGLANQRKATLAQILDHAYDKQFGTKS